MRKALERMLKFYGFVFRGKEVVVEEERTFYQRHWVRRSDHNHLRITRILRSLRVLGLEDEAEEFFEALRRVYEKLKREGPRERMIGYTSLIFWTRAAKRPLFLAPDDEEDRGRGQKFLYDFERNRVEGGRSEANVGEASATATNGNSGEPVSAPDHGATKTQTSKVPAIPNGQKNDTTANGTGFPNQDPSKATNILKSSASSSNSSKRKLEDLDNESD